MSRLIDLTRSVLGPKYDGIALRSALTDYLGERTLGNALHHLVIPSVNVTRCQTKVFTPPMGQRQKVMSRFAQSMWQWLLARHPRIFLQYK